MASSHDFHVDEAPEQAQARAAGILASLGFRVTSRTPTSLHAERGSKGLTIWFGALAGKSLHMSFDVDVFAGESGGAVLRLNRNMGRAAVKGGAIGASKTNAAFEETANALHQEFASAGILTASVSN